MAKLIAYFDESGTDQGSPVVVVAGIVASAKQWSKFDQKWRKLVKAAGVSAFHMTDFESSYGEFKGWSSDRKKEFIISLIEVIRAHARIFFLQGVKKEDFEAVLPEFPEIEKSPYNFCCELSAIAFDFWAGKSPSRKEYTLVFERGNKFTTEIIAMFKKMKGADSITLMDGKTCTPLQAADLLTYEMYKQFRNYVEQGLRPPRKSRIALLRGMKVEGGIHDPRTIRTPLKLVSDYRAGFRKLFPKLLPEKLS